MNTLFSIGIGLHLLDRLSSPMKSVTQTTGSFSKSLKSLSESCDQFSRGFAVMTKTLEKAKAPFAQIREQADKMRDIGKGMALKGTASMVIGLAPSVDAAGFEKGIAEVATLTDMGVKEFRDRYGRQVVDLSVELGQDPALVVKGMYQAISAGIAPEDAVEFMKKTGQAAIAGVSDIFTATDLSTSIKNAFNVPVSEMGKINDVIFQTVRKGKTTYAEIAGSFSQVGASAASAGISLEHVQSAVAQMTLGGVRTERAYTALKYAMDALVAPSESGKKAFEKLGIEVNAETVRQKDLLGVMDELKQAMSAFSENEQAEMIADIFGSQEAQLFVKDFGTNTEKYKGMLKDITDSTGVTNDAYKKMAETSSHQFEKMKQSFKAIRIAAGATILPVINTMLGAIKSILTPIANFAQRHKLLSGILLGGAIAISGVVAAIGMMGIAAGMAIKGYAGMRIAASLFTTHKWKMITAIRSMTAALMPNIRAMLQWGAATARASFTGIISGLKGMTLAVRTFSLSAIAGIRAVSIAMLTTPVGWIIMGVAAMAGAGYMLYRNWDKVSKGLSGAWNFLKENWKKVLNVFLWVSPITMPIMALNKLSKKIFGMNLFEAGKKIIISLWDGIKSMINKPVEAIKGMAAKMRNLLPFSPAKEGPFKDLHKIRIIETIAETMRPAPAVAAMSKAMRTVRTAIQPLTQPVRQALEPVKAMATPLIQPVFQKLHAVKTAIQPLTQPVRQALEKEQRHKAHNPPQSPFAKGEPTPPLVKGGGDRGGKAGSSVTVNYSPSITINGTSPQVKEGFEKIFKAHAHELVKMMRDAQVKDMRLAY